VLASTHLAFVGDRCCDHSPSSGYDQVCTLFPAAGWLSGRALEAGETRWIRAPWVAADPSLVHVFYGDCSGATAVAPVRERWPDATIVLTVHQPIARMLRDRAAMHALMFADAILTVSEVQARELTALDAGVPVRAIPHGVWTRAFGPPHAPDRVRREVLLVGNYLRDWRATERIVELLARRGVRCRLVGTNAPRERVDAFEEDDREAAAGHLLRYVGDPEARAARSEMLRARAQRFDWRFLASRYAAAYAEVAGQQRGHRVRV
jgi:glycosyltransferase involved in cell wall biosynthesis